MSWVRFSDGDSFLIATRDERLEPWFARRFAELDPASAECVLERWLRHAPGDEVSELWRHAVGGPPLGARGWLEPRVLRHALSTPLGGIVVLRQQVERPYEPRQLPELPPPAKSLAEEAQSLTVVMVDLFGNPVTEGFAYVCMLDEDGERKGKLTSDGLTLQEKLRPGGGTIEFSALHADSWFERAAPPEGWLRNGFAVIVVDKHGEPLGKHRYKITFENGTTSQGELDEAGQARVERTPSYPLSIAFTDFDAERWV